MSHILSGRVSHAIRQHRRANMPTIYDQTRDDPAIVDLTYNQDARRDKRYLRRVATTLQQAGFAVAWRGDGRQWPYYLHVTYGDSWDR